MFKVMISVVPIEPLINSCCSSLKRSSVLKAIVFNFPPKKCDCSFFSFFDGDEFEFSKNYLDCTRSC